MSVSITGQTVYSGSIFYFDTNNVKSYVGEPTTNRNQQISNYTGTNYADGSHGGEWSSNPTRFSKTYTASIATPIGFGATLCSETATAGYYHLSSMGGDSESGAHSISCYIYPLSSITNFTIGMLGDSGNTITFNFTTGAITYGGSISNRNAFMSTVVGFPGWYRVGANIEGRAGGWVGCLGLDTYTSYTPSAPYKSFYITGMQYEYKDHCTPYVFGTRSATQGLLDLTRNTTVDLTNAKFDSSGSLNFPINASANSYATTNTNCNLTGDQTLTAWIKPTFGSSTPHRTVICTDSSYQYGIKLMNYKNNARWGLWVGWGSSNYEALTGTDINNNQWKMITGTWKQSTGIVTLYLNGAYVTQFSTGNTNAISLSTGNIWIGMGYEVGFGNGQSYEGKIDSAAIYNRTLNGDEILKLYNRSKGRYGL
jgi:hypothetical protein